MVLRIITEAYLHLVLFRHVDESLLTERERETIKLTKEELREIAAPMGTVVSRQSYAKKHGRAVIAAAESYESVLDLFFWMRRVNRIAKRYRKVQVSEETIEGTVFNGPVSGQDESAGTPGSAANGKPTGGGGFGIFNPGHHG